MEYKNTYKEDIIEFIKLRSNQGIQTLSKHVKFFLSEKFNIDVSSFNLSSFFLLFQG